MYRVLPCAAVLSAALISGCGGSDGAGTTTAGQNPPATGASTGDAGSGEKTDQGDDPEVKRQNQIADCMKKEGFTYIPHPDVYESADSPRSRFGQARSLLQPDSEVRKWRERYGFGSVAAMLLPNDPQVAPPKQTTDPNKAVVAKLDRARRKAYNLALIGSATEGGGADAKAGDAPSKEADKKVDAYKKSCLGRTFNTPEKISPAKKTADHRLVVKFTNDPAVESATQKYGTCMKGRGHKLNSLSSDPLSFTQAATNDMAIVPDGAAARGSGDTVTKQDLTKDVKVSLDDLECRSEYAKLVRSTYPTILDAYEGEGAG